jgi:hypothetical protein
MPQLLYRLFEGCYVRWKEGLWVEALWVKHCNLSGESCTCITHNRDRNAAKRQYAQHLSILGKSTELNPIHSQERLQNWKMILANLIPIIAH